MQRTLPSDGVAPELRLRAASAVSIVSIIGVLDASIANTALPTIARELHASAAASVWVVTAFQLVATMGLFSAASLGQAYGLTRIYRTGIAIFAAASLVSALAPSLPWLLAGRALQGLGATGVMALSPAIFREIFPSAQLGRAIGLNAMVISVAAAAGPTIGGAILAVLPWPWLFGVNVPLLVLAALLQHGALPQTPGDRGRLDVPSAAASALGFAGLVLGLNALGRGDASAPLLLAGGVLALAWFAYRQTRLPRPLIAIRLFAVPRFTLSAITSMCAWCGTGIAFVALPFLYQNGFGVSPFASGLLLTSWPLGQALFTAISGRLSDRYPAYVLSTTGLIVYAVGLALFATMPAAPSPALLVAYAAIAGGGFGLFQSPNNRELMTAGPRSTSGSAGAVLAAMRVFGQTSGAALVSAAFALAAARAAAPVAHSAVPIVLWVGAGLALAAAAASVSRRGTRRAG